MKKMLLSFAALMIAAVASAQTDVTFDFTANEWNHPLSSGSLLTDKALYNQGNISDALSKEGIDIVFKQGARLITIGTDEDKGSKANTCPKYFEANSVKHIRIFNKNIMKVLAPAGKAITKIAFEMNNTTFNMTNQGEGELDATNKAWTGNATLVKIKAGATNQIKTMTVTIADKTADTTTPAAEAEETVFLDFNDPTIHKEFTGITSTTYFSEDLNIIEGIRNDDDILDTDNLIRMTVPFGTASTKNGFYYGSGKVYLYLRTGKTTIKCDADKIIKNIKMSFYNSGSWNNDNTINGETSSYAQLTGDGWTGNSNVVELVAAGATRIKDITFVLADRPVEDTTPTGINNANAEADAAKANVVKKYVDGKQVVIVKNGKKYNVAGAQIK